MTKVLVQPAGYSITVVSWENDADFYATKTMSGLTESQARLVVDIVKLFRSNWKHDTIRGETSFDNLYELSDCVHKDMCSAIAKIIGNYPLFNELYGWTDFKMPTDQDFENYAELGDVDIVDEMSDAVYELLSSLGLSGQQDGQSTRVADSITVHYHPEAVYAQDVTSTFT